jgi:hypothetical protein
MQLYGREGGNKLIAYSGPQSKLKTTYRRGRKYNIVKRNNHPKSDSYRLYLPRIFNLFFIFSDTDVVSIF